MSLILSGQQIETAVSSDGSVQRFESPSGLRIYRIRAQVLGHLVGYPQLILGPDTEPTFVDAGSGEGPCPDQIATGLTVINREFEPVDPSRISRLIISHGHIDHFGGARDLKRIFGAEIWMHSYESRILSSFNERAAVSNQYFMNFLIHCGVPAGLVPEVIRNFGFLPGRVPSAFVEHPVFGGEQLDGLVLHHLPGHSPGHLAIEAGPFILSGDLILSKTLTQIWPERVTPHTGLRHYMDSIEKLNKLALDFERRNGQKLLALPAHEEVIADLPARIELVRKSVDRRNDRLLEILRKSERPMTTWEISRKMYLTCNSNRALFALSDVGSRIEYLQQLGKIAVANYEEIDYTGPAAFAYSSCG